MKSYRRRDGAIFGPYSSYHGKVRNTQLTITPHITAGHGTPINSVSAGHVIIGDKDLQPTKVVLDAKEREYLK